MGGRLVMAKVRSEDVGGRGVRRRSKYWFLVALLATAIFAVDGGVAKANTSPGGFRYELVMSENDALCKPLTAVYNELLKKWLKKRVWHREYMGAMPDTTDFEANDPEAFAKAGLFPPESVGNWTDHRGRIDREFYELDIRGDGDKRLVSVHDVFGGNEIDRATFIDIFEKGVTLDDVSAPDEPPASWGPSELDPSQLDGNADTRFLFQYQNKKLKDGNLPIYFLEKWPNFKKIYRSFVDDNKTAPAIGGGGDLRIFIDIRGHIFIVQNSGDEFPLDSKYLAGIVVYEIIDKQPNDVCYISLISKAGEYPYE